MMTSYPSRPVVVRYDTGTSTTSAFGGYVTDSNGDAWRIVPGFVTRGTCERRAVIRDGVIYEE
jgi:hypothetical protein